MLIYAVDDQTTTNSVLVREAIMIFELIRGRALNVEESRAAMMKARHAVGLTPTSDWDLVATSITDLAAQLAAS
jgi:hypothetical protein